MTQTFSLFDFPDTLKSCVCCHEWRNLTQHHILPVEFVPFLSKFILQKSHVTLCTRCHLEYERSSGADGRLEILNGCFFPLTGVEFKSVKDYQRFMTYVNRYRRKSMDTYLSRKKRKIMKVLKSYEERGIDYKSFMGKLEEESISAYKRIPSTLLKDFIEQMGEKNFILMWKRNFEDWLVKKGIFAGDTDLRECPVPDVVPYAPKRKMKNFGDSS